MKAACFGTRFAVALLVIPTCHFEAHANQAASACPQWYSGTWGAADARAILRDDNGKISGRVDVSPLGTASVASMLGVPESFWTGRMCLDGRRSGDRLVASLLPEGSSLGESIDRESGECSAWGPVFGAQKEQGRARSIDFSIGEADGLTTLSGSVSDTEVISLAGIEPQTECSTNPEPAERKTPDLDGLRCGDGGCNPNRVLALVESERVAAFTAELAQMGITEFERCETNSHCRSANYFENSGDLILFALVVGGLQEGDVVRRLSALDYVKVAERDRVEAGGSGDLANFSIAKFFGGPPNNDTARRAVDQVFRRYFATVSQGAKGLSYRLIQRQPFLYRIEVEGPSRFLALRKPHAWESITFEITFSRPFSSSGDAMAAFLSVPTSKWAVWPEGQRPNPARLKEFEGIELAALQLRLLSELSLYAARPQARR